MNNIVLLGHGYSVKVIIEKLHQSKIDCNIVALVTHPYEDHRNDLNLMEKRKKYYKDYVYNVFDVESDFGINILEAANVNDDYVLEWIEKFSPKYILSVGCRNIIKKDFLNKFNGKVLNIHTAPLPLYRGGAGDSWMILNNEFGKKQFGCVHFIDSGIDTGDIIAKSYYEVPDKCYPIDIYKSRMDISGKLVIQALNNLNSINFTPTKQNIDEATTFPKLNTPVDGKIDFKSFSGKEVELFVYAFGYPYEGAHCYLGEKKINILEAEFLDTNSYHSFANGLIIGKNNKGQYKVCVNNGVLLIKKIEISSVETPLNKIFRLGRYLK